MSGRVSHIPVMLDEVVTALAPAASGHVVDGTFGAGGYSRAILSAGARVTGFDRDPDTIRSGAAMVDEFDGRLDLVHAPFSEMERRVSPSSVNGVVLDVGVSSMQIDQAERGFSFQKNGPLDMRMAQSGMSAAEVVNTFTVSDLTRIIGILGEERHAARVARAIEKERSAGAIETTGHLARLVEKAVGRGAKDRIHPATRTFQGLRIFVNDELRELGRALSGAERILKPGGRLVVVTFHSLEDRIVKRFFQDRTGTAGGSRHMPEVELKSATFRIEGKAMIKASDEEAAANPRARSAKLRAGTRTDAAPRETDMTLFGFPNLPWPHFSSVGGRSS
ncbi:16S rRNA (cytosine(1402)-N(4))-methyltransferase RsmH [Oricola cellulosilytica]|uniref:16S rRNA (cytosine(1402)-N(4))-methyltransferase RsmH n=1 Tax=Oricola cellulosilytica TaxID=1429082 RepID=UPI001CBAA38A|nr:16S rRNA (cytosine(1402)-N(4))-methyltransferase RsmH [Oricola cellulosilytica]